MTEPKKRRTRAKIDEIWLLEHKDPGYDHVRPTVAFLNQQDADQVTQLGKDLFGIEASLTKVKVWKLK